jgi:YD repeat-containing protein
LLILGVAAYAAETITYTYDARGRLTKVVHSGTVNNNVMTNYVYDDAENYGELR